MLSNEEIAEEIAAMISDSIRERLEFPEQEGMPFATNSEVLAWPPGCRIYLEGGLVANITVIVTEK